MEFSFDKDASLQPSACYFFKKETPKQGFSNGFCKVFKITYFIEHLPKAASVRSKEFFPAKSASVLVVDFFIASFKPRNQATDFFTSILHIVGDTGEQRVATFNNVFIHLLL